MWTRVGRRFLFITSMAVFAAACASAPAPHGGDAAGEKPVVGEDAFTVVRSAISPQARARAKRTSVARLRKIEGLRRLLDRPGVDRTATAFRLAEAYWEEAEYALWLAMDEYQAAYACWVSKRCVRPAERPTTDHGAAVSYYQAVLRAAPDHPRRARIIYRLGRTALEMSLARGDRELQATAERYLREVVERFPASADVSQSYLLLGDSELNRGALAEAAADYERFVRRSPNHERAAHVHFELGAIHLHEGEPEEAAPAFARALALTEEGHPEAAKLRHRIRVALRQTFGGPKRLLTPARFGLGDERTLLISWQIVWRMIASERYADAVALCERLVARAPTSPAAVYYAGWWLEARRRLGGDRELERDINAVVDLFAPDGPWFEANQGEKRARELAESLATEGLEKLATHYSREGARAEREGRDAGPATTAAARYYRRLLARYPSHRWSSEARFGYAESLHLRGDNAAAAEQYEQALRSARTTAARVDAALGLAQATAAMLANLPIERVDRLYIVRDGTWDRPVGRVRPMVRAREVAPTALHDLERRVVRAADLSLRLYVEARVAREALSEGDALPDAMFVAAHLFYAHGQMIEASVRLQVIFQRFPKYAHIDEVVRLAIRASKQLAPTRIEDWGCPPRTR